MSKIDFSDSIAKAVGVTFGLFYTDKLKDTLWCRLVLDSVEAGPMRPSQHDEEQFEGLQEREVFLKFRDEDYDKPENNLLAVVKLVEIKAAKWVVECVQFTYHNGDMKPGWMEIDDVSACFPTDGHVCFCPDYVTA